MSLLDKNSILNMTDEQSWCLHRRCLLPYLSPRFYFVSLSHQQSFKHRLMQADKYAAWRIELDHVNENYAINKR